MTAFLTPPCYIPTRRRTIPLLYLLFSPQTLSDWLVVTTVLNPRFHTTQTIQTWLDAGVAAEEVAAAEATTAAAVVVDEADEVACR